MKGVAVITVAVAVVLFSLIFSFSSPATAGSISDFVAKMKAQEIEEMKAKMEKTDLGEILLELAEGVAEFAQLTLIVQGEGD